MHLAGLAYPVLFSGMGHPYWARRRLAQLDPDRDAREMLHLTFEVRYGAPDFIHSMFSLAFARQAAVPGIAEVLFRGGAGLIMTDARRRNNDTLLFFGELFRHGTAGHGAEVIARMNRVHAHMPISNDLNLYTLATLICEPRRVGRQLTGREFISDREFRALFVFWRGVGLQMGISSIPPDEHTMYKWYLAYETAHYAPSAAGRAIALALADEFAERWFPKMLSHIGRQFYFSLFDDELLRAFGLVRPHWAYNLLVRVRVNGYLRFLVPLLPDGPDRSIIDYFGRDYVPYDFAKVGVRT